MRNQVDLLCGAFVAIASGCLVTALAGKQAVEGQRKSLREELDLASKELESELNNRLSLVRGLAAFAKSNPDFTREQFQKYTDALEGELSGIRSLQWAPNGVITYLTREEENRKAVGFDLKKDSKHKGVILEAMQEEAFHVAGPLNLIQGGSAVIGRLSVHCDDPLADEGSFLGFATVLIEPDALFAGLAARQRPPEACFALRGTENSLAPNLTFFGRATCFEDPDARADVDFYGSSWELAAQSPFALSKVPAFWIALWALGLVLSALAGWWYYAMLRRPVRLRLAVDEATAALRDSEVQLRQYQKTEALSQLTGGIAHDFNNILAVVQGSLELLEIECTAQPAANEPIALAKAATEKGANLTRSLLAFARKSALQPQLCDCNRLVESTASLLNRTLGEKIQVHTDLGKDIGHVLIDPSQFESVLVHLAVNARHAMPDGGMLMVRTNRVDHIGPGVDAVTKPHVLCTISDNGAGMSEGVLEKAFEPFFTTRPGKGPGLGLSMAHGFVTQSSGDIEIKSQVDGGTTVRIYLPLVPAELESESEDLPSPEYVLPIGRTILVAEDNEGVRAVVVAQLKSFGLSVLEAENATEAARLMRSGSKIDALLTDVIMPGGPSGYELAESVRALQANIGVIFMSGYEADEVPPNDLEATHLHKPFRKVDLRQAVLKALQVAPGPTGEAGIGPNRVKASISRD